MLNSLVGRHPVPLSPPMVLAVEPLSPVMMQSGTPRRSREPKATLAQS
jgi:hypothetical protein